MHAKGKLTAKERIEVFLDPESFEKTGMYLEQDEEAYGPIFLNLF